MIRFTDRPIQIDFRVAKHCAGVPEPEPASRFLPDWWRAQNPSTGKHPARTDSLKSCVPLQDSLTAGYIIPMWEDCLFTASPEQGVQVTASAGLGCAGDGVTVGTHEPEQMRGTPWADTPYGHTPLKFNSPWAIRTEPGYSCLFTQPFNRGDSPFELFTAIVDTDEFFTPVTFPFWWKTNTTGTVIPRGYPLVQVIPFRRTEYKMSAATISTEELHSQNQQINKLTAVFQHAYRRFWWSKKRYR